MEKVLLTAIDDTFNELIRLIASFDQEQINVVPFKGSWTAGQVVEHIIKSDGGFVQLLNGPVRDTEGEPDAHIAELKRVFLDFTIKMKAPDFIQPEDTFYEKFYLLSSIQDIKSGLEQAIATKDLTKTCTTFELPGSGYPTGLEAVHFVLYHTQRHIYQLKNIYERVTSLV
jgi:hypothetical protein